MSLPPLDVPGLLRRHHLTPRKSLGQNFLIEESFLRKIIAVAEVEQNCEVLEVGAGLGSLTRHLAEAARRVVAVELDQRLMPVLSTVLAGRDNVRLEHGDMLALDPGALMDLDGYLVVANIPYYITSALIRHLLEARVKPGRLVLTVQREVAERICAEPGEMSLLALSVQVYGKPRPVLRIPAGAFYPPPQVDSSVLRVDLYPQPLMQGVALERFFQLAKAGFSQKRKMLRNALAGGLGWGVEQAESLLRAADIDPRLRAETLSIAEWGRLADVQI